MALRERGNVLDGLPQAEILSPRGGMRRRDDHKALNHVLVHVCNSPCNLTPPARREVPQAEASIHDFIGSQNSAKAAELLSRMATCTWQVSVT